MRLLSYLFFLCIIISLSSCPNQGNADIEKLLSDRQTALETNDVDLYMSLISPDYSQEKDDKTIKFEEVKKSFLSIAGLFDTLDIEQQDLSIYKQGETVKVVQVNLVEASIEESKSRFKIIDKIELVEVDGKWLIVKESDADYFRGFAFGGTN